MLRIILIRHGECFMNLELKDKIGGRSNASALTPLGEAQSAALGRQLKRLLPAGASVDVQCFSSTAVRAVDTARIALHAAGLDAAAAAVVAADELLEQDMGLWEGAQRADAYTPANLALIQADTHGFRAPGGESQRDVEERMMQFLQQRVLPATRPGGASLVFGHGMAFKCVLRALLSSDARMTRKIVLDNTSMTEIGWVSEAAAATGLQPGWHVLRVNATAHLDDLGAS